MSKRKVLYLILIMFVILVVIVVRNLWTFPEREMNKKVNSINELAPLWIDSVTRFDSLNLLANNTLLFHYQLIDIAKQDIDTANFINLIHPTMVDEVKENNNFKLFRAYKSIFTYRYKDVNGAVIKDVTVTPNQYQ